MSLGLAPPIDYAAIGERIADLRKFRRMSLQAVADRAGLSKPHVWNLERGNTPNPGIETLNNVARALGTSLANLLGLDPKHTVLDPFAHKLALIVEQRFLELAEAQ